ARSSGDLSSVSLYVPIHPPALPSFPTRRSSDLQCGGRGLDFEAVLEWNLFVVEGLQPDLTFVLALPAEDATTRVAGQLRAPPDRSEEHTSELQSRVDLVCRLLLEKKQQV